MYFENDGKLVVNVTDVVAFEWYWRWREKGHEVWEDFIERLTRRSRPSQRMILDRALHKSYRDVVKNDEWSCRYSKRLMRRRNPFKVRYHGKNWIFDVRDRMGVTTLWPDRTEHFVSREYDFNGRAVELRGKIDAIAGGTIIEYQSMNELALVANESPLLFNEHGGIHFLRRSFQWRAYLAMHPECENLRYEGFHIIQIGNSGVFGESAMEMLARVRKSKRPFEQRDCFSSRYAPDEPPFYEKEYPDGDVAVPNLIINQHCSLQVDRYEGMEDEVQERLAKFVAFCEDLERGVVPGLPGVA